jgi:predicted dehydrogenase
MTPPRIALVGAGSMGSLHARVIAANPACELAAVIDALPEAGRRLADTYNAAYLSSVDEATDIQGVVIAATTEAHYGLARQVLEAGWPVLVEKPLTPSIEDSRRLVDYATQHAIPLMCGLLERYNPAILTARRLISDPILIQATRHSPYVPRIKSGVAWDLLVHDVDLVIGLVPSSVRRSTSVSGVFHPSSLATSEDIIEAHLEFSSGAVASVSASRLSQRKVRAMTVYERDSMVEIDLLRRDVTVTRHVADDAFTDQGRSYRQQAVIEIPELVTSREPLATQLDRFLGLLAGEVDADAERLTILPSHEVVAEALASDSGRSTLAD